MRLIDADKLLDELKWFESSVSEYKKEEVRSYIRRVEAAPTVDAVPVVHGRWEDKPTGAYGQWQSWCSACGKHSGIGGVESNRHKPYCPNCGADMRGGAEDGC